MNLPLLWIIPALPLAAVALNLLLGDRLGKRGTAWLACGAVGRGVRASRCARCCTLAALPEHERAIVETVYTWMQVGDFSVDVSFLLDPLSAVMMLVVTGVGFLIHVYSIGYMAHDPSFRRFFLYLNLFMFAMLTLVLADNFLLMFVGWEGVGLCSYLLIGFWYEQPVGRRGGEEGVHRQPHRRLRRSCSACFTLFACGGQRSTSSGCSRRRPHVFAAGGGGRSPPRRCCCSSAPPARARRSRSTSGCPTRWRARRRSRR